MAQNQDEEHRIQETGDLTQERKGGRYLERKLCPRNNIGQLIHMRAKKRFQENFLPKDKTYRNKHLEKFG